MRWFCATVLSIFLTSSQGFAKACIDIFRPAPVSRSVERNIFEYSQPKGRLLKEYGERLAPGFRAAIERLRAGQTFFDGGAGLGLAALQIAQLRPGVHAIAANMRDYLAQFFEFAAQIRGDLFGGTDPRVSKILGELAAALGRPIGDVKTARSEIERLRGQGFEVRTGLVQQTLRAMIARGEKIDLYADVWGAYAYSADRAELIQLIYRSLADGGEAYLLSQNQIIHDLGEHDHRIFVKDGGGATVNFEQYLGALRDPAITIEGKWPETIVIRKIPGRESLDLGLRMKPETVRFAGEASFPVGVRYEAN